MANGDTDDLLAAAVEALVAIERDDIPALLKTFTDTQTAVEGLAGEWHSFSRYGGLDERFARINALVYTCFINPIELRQDIEVALSEGYLSRLLDLRSSRLVPTAVYDLGGGLRIRVRPDDQEPGVGQSLPIIHYSDEYCHGRMLGGLNAGELGVRPGFIATDDLSGADQYRLRLGVTFGLFPQVSPPNTLKVQLARGHGICPSFVLPEAIDELSFVTISRTLEGVLPSWFSVWEFMPPLSPELPQLELLGVTRNEPLLNLHFTFRDRPPRPRARFARFAPTGDWDYAVAIDFAPIREKVEHEITSYDYETAINKNIKPICGIDPIDIHITGARVSNWNYILVDASYNFNLDIDYDFVLTGFPVHGTMYGIVNIKARPALTQMEAEMFLRSGERDSPDVNCKHCPGPINDSARKIIETISQQLFSRIGPTAEPRTIFAPGNAIRVAPRIQPNHLELLVWAA